MHNNKTIKNLPASERPYEKFLSLGASGLSDADLLAIIIKTGTRDKTVIDIAQDILSGRHGNLLNLYEISYEELLSIPGIGQIKAIQLKAIAELSLRIAKTKKVQSIRMNNPQTIADYYMEQMRHLTNEVVICAYFDVKSRFLGDKFISKGSLSSSVVDIGSIIRTALDKNASKLVLLHNHPSGICAYFDVKSRFLGDKFISKGSLSSSVVDIGSIIRTALDKNASKLVLLHNHPSGDCTPSRNDIAVTDRLIEGSGIFSIELCDHIIIGDNEYYSFYENKLI